MSKPIQRESARRVVARLRQQAGYEIPRLPPFQDLLDLADAYLAEVGGGQNDTRERLGDTGQVYVAPATARAYEQTARTGDLERARQELTEVLLDAKQSDKHGTWRARRRSDGIDLFARVVPRGRLMVVEHIWYPTVLDRGPKTASARR